MANAPINPEHALEHKRTIALLSMPALKWGKDWGAIEDAGGGRIRRAIGAFRIEGSISADFAVFRQGKEMSLPVPIEQAVTMTEAFVAQEAVEVAETRKAAAEASEAAKATELLKAKKLIEQNGGEVKAKAPAPAVEPKPVAVEAPVPSKPKKAKKDS